jgi:hypothetical protein
MVGFPLTFDDSEAFWQRLPHAAYETFNDILPKRYPVLMPEPLVGCLFIYEHSGPIRNRVISLNTTEATDHRDRAQSAATALLFDNELGAPLARKELGQRAYLIFERDPNRYILALSTNLRGEMFLQASLCHLLLRAGVPDWQLNLVAGGNPYWQLLKSRRPVLLH